MKRRPGALLPLEVSVLRAALEMARHGEPEFHGYAIAREIKQNEAARQLTAHGTLYRALDKMEELGFLESRWEDQTPESEGRPRRRLYRVTAAGEQAYQAVRPSRTTGSLRNGLAES